MIGDNDPVLNPDFKAFPEQTPRRSRLKLCDRVANTQNGCRLGSVPRINKARLGSLAKITNIASKSVVRVTPSGVDLNPSPIQPEWVLGGSPTTWKKEVARSRDRMSQIIVWECTAGLFMWHYNKDESLIVISGEAFATTENGQELRFGPGDVGFFPAGTTCTWRVPGLWRKIAIMRDPMWPPLGFAVKALNRLLQMAGITGKPPLPLADHAPFSEPPRKAG